MSTGRRASPEIAWGICDRCGFRYKLNELIRDGQSPGLLVCEKDYDVKDPWRLPPQKVDRVNLRLTRPEVPLTGPGGVEVFED